MCKDPSRWPAERRLKNDDLEQLGQWECHMECSSQKKRASKAGGTEEKTPQTSGVDVVGMTKTSLGKKPTAEL